MQLNQNKSGVVNVSTRLALATATLLSGVAAHAADSDWKVSASTLMYKEKDRVQAIEPALDLKKDYADESSLNIRLVFDSLSGASPNGAMAANVAQTFTSASGSSSRGNSSANSVNRPSGSLQRQLPSGTYQIQDNDDSEGGVYNIKAGNTPLDPSFMDTRVMGGLSWSGPMGDGLKGTVGGAISAEQDFISISSNGALARDFNGKNTTVSLGINLEHDIITPHGGVSKDFSTYIAHETTGTQDTKDVGDLSLGLTQVISRRWLTQFNLALSYANGYQNDPYKIMTVALDGNLMADPADSSSYLYLYESRPRTRLKKIAFWENKFAIFNNDTLDLSARYSDDDWGIRSKTLDTTYHWQMSEAFYLEPHYRFYRQSAADFYRPFLSADGEVDVTSGSATALIANASSDGRLAAFSARTLGIRAGYQLSRDEELSLRVEHYQQYDENRKISLAKGTNLYGMQQFAPLSANWIQLGFTTRW
jgi:hypothetical protein